MFGVLPVGNLTNNLGLGGQRSENSGIQKPVRESEISAPAEMMAIGESDHLAFMRNLGYDFYTGSFRHQNKVNMVFCDGHVESPTLQFLFADTSDATLCRGTATTSPTANGWPRSVSFSALILALFPHAWATP